MSTKKMDWKLGGQMFAMLVQFFTNISALFKRQEVGPEILDWINGPGCVFFNLKMREVAEEFRDLRIVCDIDPIRPIGMYVKENVKPGVIVWEPTNNSSLLTYVSQGEERGFAGDEIRKALMEEHGPRVMNATILFYLLDNLKRIPSCWEGKDVCF